MRTVTMREARARLPRLVDVIERGQDDDVVIIRKGRPVARLLPISADHGGLRIGVAEGEFTLPATRDTTDTEVAALFFDGPCSKPPASQIPPACGASGRRPGRLAGILDDFFFDELSAGELAAWNQLPK